MYKATASRLKSRLVELKKMGEGIRQCQDSVGKTCMLTNKD